MTQRSPFSLLRTRRQILKAAAGTTALALTSQVWGLKTRAQETIVVGFIYVGPKDDFGWNQAHAEGNAGIADLEWVNTVEEASVPETTAVQESMRSMIELDGATVLFPTSFGYFDPHILQLAEEYPEVQFFHAGGLYIEGEHPENVGSYYGYIDEGQFINGVVAAHMSQSGNLGFIAAKPIPTVLRNVNSFTLGARSIDPEITTQLVFTGDWSLPVKEAEAANSMVDQGVEVITCHVDSPKIVMETAERRGIYCCGYHTDQVSLAPEGYLTGAEWDWTSVYANYAALISDGQTLMSGGIPHLVRGGLKENFCKMSPYGPAVTDEAKADADAVLEQFMDGSMVIYQGELKDNEGNTILAADQNYEQTAIELEQMNWLVEGVNGTTQS